MKAFYNNPSIKEAVLRQLQAHYDANEIIQGVYWQHGKGCAVGCTIHSSDHMKYESELGIPKWLALVEDRIFESLSNNEAKEWPILFIKSINLGSDLDKIKIRFLIFVLESVMDKFDHKEFHRVKKSIKKVLNLLKKDPENKTELRAAAIKTANAYAADAATANIVHIAHAVVDAAVSSAYAGFNAVHIARAVADAADVTAFATFYASDTDYNANTVYEKAYKYFADKLIEFIKDCK